MENYFTPKPIKSWTEFVKLAKKFKTNKKQKWIFRGQKARESLKSSLDRAIKYFPKDISKAGEAEKRLLRDFKRRYHQYSSDSPRDKDYLEWFAIMQHYGAPTRLLDFTYSPFVAAYFASEYTSGKTREETFEIFAINAKWAIEQSIQNNGGSKETRNFFEKPVSNTCRDRKLFEKYFIEGHPKKFACPFNPFRLNERISLQNGVFMCPGNVHIAFDANLKKLEGWSNKDNIVKIVLIFKKKEIINARGNLYDLNITRATLFPGLEGFAKSLAVFPPKMLIPKQV